MFSLHQTVTLLLWSLAAGWGTFLHDSHNVMPTFQETQLLVAPPPDPLHLAPTLRHIARAVIHTSSQGGHF